MKYILAMIAPFGSWDSPITSDLLIQDSVTFYELAANDSGLYWTELRPKEKGRLALLRYDGIKTEEVLPEVSVRTRVHEYGGGAFSLSGPHLVFSNDRDQQLYVLKPDGSTFPLTHQDKWRFADGDESFWVCEKHEEEVENCLVLVGEEGVKTIAEGHDFYALPRLSPDGSKLSYITWDFPDMPWDASTLWLAEVGEDGKLRGTKRIAGGKEESICQVKWGIDGHLYFVSDRTGFWNLYRLKQGKVEALTKEEGELGIPHWVFGQPTYAFLHDGTIIASMMVKGIDQLVRIDPENKTLTDLHQPFTSIRCLVTYKDKVYFIGSSPTTFSSIIGYDPKTNHYQVVKKSSKLSLPNEWISKGEMIEFQTVDGKVGYGFYYPPHNPDFEPPKGELPPLIVQSHGGPTSINDLALSLKIQYWTSRGFAFVDVNYGGSTGYGREYFKRLEGKWGIVDVNDCISAAQFLSNKGLADPNRLLIRGGSAGGYTTLAALTFHDVFAAGTCLYGVSDLELLNQESHKFELKYTDRLIAPFPEQRDIIRKRSPIHFIDQISAPILLLHGEEDKVIPPNQAILIYERLKEKNIPVGLILFEGEGHGFRKGENIKKVFDSELYFYAKILGITLPHPFEEAPVEIIGFDPNS